MAELSTFLSGGGGAQLRLDSHPGHVVVSSGSSGTLLTITPSASQYVVITYFRSGTGSGVTGGISLTMGGRSIFTNKVVGGGSFQSGYVAIGGGEDYQPGTPWVAGKGEQVVVTASSATSQPLNVAYLLMEEDS